MDKAFSSDAVWVKVKFGGNPKGPPQGGRGSQKAEGEDASRPQEAGVGRPGAGSVSPPPPPPFPLVRFPAPPSPLLPLPLPPPAVVKTETAK